jgi:hypothetical protein
MFRSADSGTKRMVPAKAAAASMIQASWVWVACVARAISGRATFSDDIAATTAASARHTTAVTAPGGRVRVGRWVWVWGPAGVWGPAWVWGRPGSGRCAAWAGPGRRVVVVIVGSLTF